MEKSDKQWNRLRIKPEKLEAMAEAVHNAIYLDVYRKLVKDDYFLTSVSYSEVDEGFRDIDRAAVRTVLNAVSDQIALSSERCLRAEEGWRAAIEQAQHFKKEVEKAAAHIRGLEDLIKRYGIELEKPFCSCKPDEDMVPGRILRSRESETGAIIREHTAQGV